MSTPAPPVDAPARRPSVRLVAAPEPVLREAVRLHHEALSYRSFITSFGLGFLERLYAGLLEDGLGFLVAAEEEGALAGFILGCVDADRLMSVVLRRPHRFAPAVLGAILRRPAIVRKVIETLSYGSREGSSPGVRAELVVIAVRPDVRSRGVGRALLGAFEEELRRRGAGAYKVTVHAEMDGANRFYRANGMELARQFELYGVTWNLYERKVDRP